MAQLSATMAQLSATMAQLITVAGENSWREDLGLRRPDRPPNGGREHQQPSVRQSADGKDWWTKRRCDIHVGRYGCAGA
jgi:hypothetical protein